MQQSKLSEGLSNFRAIDSFLQEAFTVLRVRLVAFVFTVVLTL